MFSTVTLHDGRTLEYAELGDADGTPVLFHPGTPAAAGQGLMITAAAARQGVRLISISRPGYGTSTPSAPGLAASAGDTLGLADLLGIGTFAVLGVSGGGPFALAVAAVAPERVTFVGTHASPGEYGAVRPEVIGDGDRRALDLLADGKPDEAMAAMNEVCDADIGGFRGLSDEEFAAALSSMTPPGEDWLERHPDLKQAFEEDFRRAVVRSDGMSYDNLCWLGPWDVDLSDVTTTVRLVTADGDSMNVPAQAAWLTARLPSVDAVVVSGGHGDACFGAADDTFAALVASA